MPGWILDSKRATGLAFLLGCLVLAAPARSQTITPYYADDYSFSDLGTPTGVPGPLGGLTFKAGDFNTLLVGGNANSASGAIYEIGLIRDADNHITGFSGSASLFASAPNIDGGLSYGPGGVLFYTGYSNNILGQILPGSTGPDKVISLTALGVASSVGSLAFVPDFAPGAGGFKLVSYNAGTFYDAELVADGSGTFDVTSVSLAATIGGGPEGVVYVPNGSALFDVPSLLVSEYASGSIASYEVDSLGNPIMGTRRSFMTGLSGAEGALIDPLTGDFLFGTFGGGNRIIAVRGFAPVPEPTGLVLLGLGGAALIGLARRRRRVAGQG